MSVQTYPSMNVDSTPPTIFFFLLYWDIIYMEKMHNS